MRNDEDKGDDGTPGMWSMREENGFNIIFLSNMEDPDTDDEVEQMKMDQIPHCNTFQHVFVNPTGVSSYRRVDQIGGLQMHV